jgi:hypothetical protein
LKIMQTLRVFSSLTGVEGMTVACLNESIFSTKSIY